MSDLNKDSAAARDSEPFLVLAETKPGKGRRRPFLRRWLVGILVLGLVAGGALAMQFGLFGGSPHKPAGSGTASNSTGSGTATGIASNSTAASSAGGNATGNATGIGENLAGLALQGISLFNGEKGAELWRLKASWAHLSQEGDTILVDAPVVRYTMGDPAANDFLDVKSEKGTVTDSQRYLTLTGNVDVKRFGDTVTGPRLDYDSKTRVMVFPEGAHLESERASGQAKVFTWDLESNTMVGEGGVNVLLKPRPEPAPETSQSGTVSGAGTPAVAPAVPAAGIRKSDDKKTAAAKPSTAKTAVKKTSDKKAAAKKTTSKTEKKPAAKKTSAKKPATKTSKQSTKQTTTKTSSKTSPAKASTPQKSATSTKSAS